MSRRFIRLLLLPVLIFLSYEASAQLQSVPASNEADSVYSTNNSGSDIVVNLGDTLWSIALRMRPDSRASMSQTMLAIFDANPEAFVDNVNMLKAGMTLRIPTANEIFQINRGDALNEVQRQHSAWVRDAAAYAVQEPSRTGLTFIPLDKNINESGFDAPATFESQPQKQEEPKQTNELEVVSTSNQYDLSLIEIYYSDESALPRQELVNIGNDFQSDERSVDESDIDNFLTDNSIDILVTGNESTLDDEVTEIIAPSSTVLRTSSTINKGFIDKTIELLTNFWSIIIGILVLFISLLIWFIRRSNDTKDNVNDKSGDQVGRLDVNLNMDDGDASDANVWMDSSRVSFGMDHDAQQDKGFGLDVMSENSTIESTMTDTIKSEDVSSDLNKARTTTEVGTKLDLARAYVDMGDSVGARSILEEVLNKGDELQKQQAQKLYDSLPN
ncbi:MAG: FimV/HubP family polar landmark protein [Woeseiaceae bacterium]|nr:FimV/HubP family polar landmark protein [Woeseiaceae bacterium]